MLVIPGVVVWTYFSSLVQVGVGQTLSRHGQAMVRRVDSQGETVWTRLVGQKDGALPTYSAGFSIVQVILGAQRLTQPG